jgi:hypothetical protein
MRWFALCFLLACQTPEPSSHALPTRAAPRLDPPPAVAVLPDSDAGATIDPDRDIWLTLPGGERVQVTNLPGAEDAEALSPDGRWLAFLAAPQGLAAVMATRVPAAGQGPFPAIQLTNQGLEDQPRAPGRMPRGFVPPPEAGPLRWRDARTIEWDAQGRTWTAGLP